MLWKNIEINKKYKAYIVFESAISLVGKTIECYIKESLFTDSTLFKLTVANEGIVIIDEIEGIFAISIDSIHTDVEVNTGVYSIVEVDNNYPHEERRVIINGNVIFNKGV